MAKPAFIYAFDNLGPERFTEVCGALLASRYAGFLLGGVGPDGGIDGELLGEWRPENLSPLIDEVVQPGQLAVFQFKHKVTARVGQAHTRAEILRMYTCTPSRRCELHSALVVSRSPSLYVLVTNAEVNSNFRTASSNASTRSWEIRLRRAGSTRSPTGCRAWRRVCTPMPLSG